jgi:regulators of stationary/sporulation gene expression
MKTWKGSDFMELAKVTTKGQITLPISIRRALNIKDGDKVAFIEKDGNFIVVNPVSLAIDEVRKEFEGEADRVGLKNEEDVAKMIKEIRKERK